MAIRIFFQIFPVALSFLLTWCFIPPSVKSVRARAAIQAFFLLCAAKFIVFASIGGDAFAPELPEKLIWIWNWAYSGMMILLALSVAGKICRLPRRFPRTWMSVLPVLAWGLSAAGVRNGVKAPQVEEVSLEFADLPPELDGCRIVHISDIHASAAAKAWRTEKIVETANAQNADIICLTGDYADGFSGRRFGDIAALGGLRAKHGVYAVSGNHEYYYDAFGWFRRYRSLKNIKWLVNSCAFPLPGLAVGGVNDPVAERFGFTTPDPSAAFSQATNGEFRVYLQHRPQVNGASAVRADLQLSGHTHGGIAPVLDRLVAAFNGGMVSGTYGDGENGFVLVSRGAGQWAGFPIRFFNDPAITVITLRRKAAGGDE
ncbi:MAG: metallophosphoesterase [Kiritimatiellae bacterium]|nr:metallophosphoesterase [Kiritimatiellia bacterium]